MDRPQPSSALPFYQQMLEINPDSLSGHAWIAQAYTRSERFDESLPHLRRAVELSPDGEDEMFDLMDEFEGVALIDGIATAADSVGVPIASNVTVTEGFDFVPGAGALGVAVDWALDPLTPFDEVSEFFQNAGGYHMVEVAGRVEGGTFSFEEARDQVRETLAVERRREAALEAARSQWATVAAVPYPRWLGSALPVNCPIIRLRLVPTSTR